MATRAASEVTLTDVTDASAVVTWYRLEAGTTAPSAPTTTDAADVPAGWSRAEPSFDPAAGTRYLYTCQQLVWGDGTCDWGDVQLSSSYEQAKLAWNRANAAAAAADEAARVATNYIRADSTGIRIANADPASATTYQHQTATETEFVVGGATMSEVSGDGFTIYDGNGTADGNVVADFGSTISIGRRGNAQLHFSENALTLNQDSLANGQYTVGSDYVQLDPRVIRFSHQVASESLSYLAYISGGSSTTREYSFSNGELLEASTTGVDVIKVNGYRGESDSDQTILGSSYVGARAGRFNALSAGSAIISGSIQSSGSETLHSHSLIVTSAAVNHGTTLSDDTGGTGIYFREKTGSENIAYIRSYGRSGSDRKRGLQLGGHNISNTAWNMLYLLTDKDGNRIVQVSEAAPWRTALGLGSLATKSSIAASEVTNLGATVVEDPEAVTVATSSWATLATVTLPAGTWVVALTAHFASNATGRRIVVWSTNASATAVGVTQLPGGSMAPASGALTKHSGVGVESPTASTKYYVRVWQNSGSSLSCQCYVKAVRVR